MANPHSQDPADHPEPSRPGDPGGAPEQAPTAGGATRADGSPMPPAGAAPVGAAPANANAAGSADTANADEGGATAASTSNRIQVAMSTSVALLIIAAIAVVFLAFLWPSHYSQPRNVSLGVVASEKTYNEMEKSLNDTAEQNGVELPFALERIDDESAARDAVKSNEVHGAMVISEKPAPVKAMLASANGMEQAQLLANFAQDLNQLPAQQAQAEGKQPSQEQMQAAMSGPDIQDIVPISEQEQAGMTLNKLVLPLVAVGIMVGLLVLSLHTLQQRVLALLLGSVAGAFLASFITTQTFGFVDGHTVPLWLSFALGILAVAAPVAGLGAIFKRPGALIGSLIALLTYPLSGAVDPREYIGVLGSIGQWFAPGAVTTLNQLLVYFPKASLWQPLLVLLVWTIVGVALLAVGSAGRRYVLADKAKGEDAGEESAAGNEELAGAGVGADSDAAGQDAAGATPQATGGAQPGGSVNPGAGDAGPAKS